MSHHHDNHATLTVSTGDANPNDRQQPVDARLSAPEQIRVRVSPDGDAGPASPTVDHSESEAKSPLSEFDDYVAAGGGASRRNIRKGFEVGDMVWGKVKSHPWWPGHIYNEAFATSAVRRTKREGQVLVAFFGDSSYGWFELSELIPFDANFAEKSRQLSSRSFLKAVEEAVDEASRRCGLGLVCRCRNPGNFCPTDVEGHYSVQVPDYEPGVYSDAQIRKARSEFGTAEMLSFVKQMALNPHGGDQKSIDFTKNSATAFAFRRAVFEQYDETYAQAFGVQPKRPSDSIANQLDQPVRLSAKAPLSGPKVIEETMHDEKSATKSVKAKENFKKDKYLFVRRDESSNTFQLSSRETSDAAGSYVLQERPLAVSEAPQALEKHEDTGFMSQDIATSTVKAEIDVVDQVQSDGNGHASQEIMLNAKPCLLDRCKESSEEMTRSVEQMEVASKGMGRPHLSGEMALPSIVNETSQSTNTESKTSIDGNITPSGPHEDFQQTEQGFLATSDEVKHCTLNVDGVPKKIKVHKRPANDLKSVTSAIEGEKKKKMKKGLNLQTTSGHLERTSTSEPVQVDASTSNLMPMDSIAEVNIELPLLLGDLQALALDPFHGVKRGIPAITRQFFLQFRSLVYQKSSPVSLPIATENEADEVRVTRPQSSVGALDGPDDRARASPFIKPVKHIVRLDDPTKAGRKRALSGRQEENSAKRLKKIKDIKALAAEKKAGGQKSSEARQGDGKESMAQAPPKVVKPELTRKVERPAKAVEPTILVIKFPPQTSLPSVAELKARFARFGPIDQSGLRVFWKTSTCRVVFLHRDDAQSAFKYALANPSLFGNVGMKCFLRELGDAASEVSEAAKARGDNGANESPRVKDPAVVQRQSSVSAQPTIQLKSILKKSTGDELGQGTGNGGSSKGSPRVKFMLAGEESSRGEQLMVGNSRNNFNSVSFADGGGAPSPVATDYNSKNVLKAISQQSLPNTLPLPTQFTKIPQHNLHNSEMAPRNTPNFINATASSTATTVDISQQMISLLTRCNDIVNNLTSLVGYVPYHPL